MTEMKDDLLNWVLMQSSNLGFNNVLELEPLREQASLRSYFRIHTESNSKIGVITRPDSEENKLFELYSCYLLDQGIKVPKVCLLYTSPSPRDKRQSRMPSSA